MVCWAVVKLGGGHNCTTGPEENIGVCWRMGGGGWAGARPGQDAGFIPQTPVLYSQLSQSFQTAAPPLPVAAGTTKTEKNMSPTSIATEAVYSV